MRLQPSSLKRSSSTAYRRGLHARRHRPHDPLLHRQELRPRRSLASSPTDASLPKLTLCRWSIGVTGIALLLFGSLKAYYTVSSRRLLPPTASLINLGSQGAGKGVLGVVYGALSTLAIGGAAAAASYGVVKALE